MIRQLTHRCFRKFNPVLRKEFPQDPRAVRDDAVHSHAEHAFHIFRAVNGPRDNLHSEFMRFLYQCFVNFLIIRRHVIDMKGVRRFDGIILKIMNIQSGKPGRGLLPVKPECRGIQSAPGRLFAVKRNRFDGRIQFLHQHEPASQKTAERPVSQTRTP